MGRRAIEIRDMLIRGIENESRYTITNTDLVLRAAQNLLDALTVTEIDIQDLIRYEIGRLVNNIRRNNKNNAQVKTVLRSLVERLQKYCKEYNNSAVGDSARPNQVNGVAESAVKKTAIGKNKKSGRRTLDGTKDKDRASPKTNGNGETNGNGLVNGHEIVSSRTTPTERVNERLLEGLHEAKKSENRKSKSRGSNSPKVRSGKKSATPTASDPNLHPSPPKIKTSPPVSTIKPTIKPFSIDETMPPSPESAPPSKSMERKPQEIQPKKESKKEEPIETVNVPADHLSDPITNSSSNISIPTLPVKRPHSTANQTDSPSPQKSKPISSSSEVLFSDRVRFIPSVKVEVEVQPHQTSPDPKQVNKVAQGDEIEGITGVRDVQGNFHRWQDEISLEPDGTEPFLHILPYVDIDLELL